jgi:hypothetical protein
MTVAHLQRLDRQAAALANRSDNTTSEMALVDRAVSAARRDLAEMPALSVTAIKAKASAVLALVMTRPHEIQNADVLALLTSALEDVCHG